MRALLLILSICLWCALPAPVVVAGTRGVVEGPAQVEDALCRGWDGKWYPQGARECQPLEAAEQAPAPAETAASQAAQASAGTGSQDQLLFLGAALAVIALAAAVIAAVLRASRRASTPDAAPEAQPSDTAGRSPPDQPDVARPAPPVASEDVFAAPAPGESEAVHDQLALANAEARLITVWTGGPYRVEFTSKDQEGDWHRNTVDITRIMRDPRNGGWHLYGFCHLWREERDYEGASIVTKILYKSRRWTLEDWITAVAGKEARGS